MTIWKHASSKHREWRIVLRPSGFVAQTRFHRRWPFWSDIARLSGMFCEVVTCSSYAQAEKVMQRDMDGRMPQQVL